MLNSQCREILLRLARHSIELGLDAQSCAPVPADDYPAPLTELKASFVTVMVARELRGCRGSLESKRPLFADVWHNAYASAFDDPRLPSLRAGECAALGIDISVLSPLEPLGAISETDLLEAMTPGQDGVVLALHSKRVTFLPKVWDTIPRKEDFLRRLKVKAGWREDFWSPEIHCFRYRTQSYAWYAQNP